VHTYIISIWLGHNGYINCKAKCSRARIRFVCRWENYVSDLCTHNTYFIYIRRYNTYNNVLYTLYKSVNISTYEYVYYNVYLCTDFRFYVWVGYRYEFSIVRVRINLLSCNAYFVLQKTRCTCDKLVEGRDNPHSIICIAEICLHINGERETETERERERDGVEQGGIFRFSKLSRRIDFLRACTVLFWKRDTSIGTYQINFKSKLYVGTRCPYQFRVHIYKISQCAVLNYYCISCIIRLRQV